MSMKSVIIAGFAVMLPLVAGSAADARIACTGDFQIVNGSPIATPFCEDDHLAKVAREHGGHFSAETIRHSLDAKYSACAVTAGDTRTMDACIEAGGNDRR